MYANRSRALAVLNVKYDPSSTRDHRGIAEFTNGSNAVARPAHVGMDFS